jgi:Tfp pilus assembly protein PilV
VSKTRFVNALGQEDGFSMIVVLVALIVGSLLSVAALAAATGDFPSARKSQDRKAAYNAAESGLQYFNFRLARDNDYWKACGDNASGRLDPRTVPGTSTRFSVELLPANGQTACSTAAPEASMIDGATGTFRIRSTGRAGNVYRSAIATYRRKSFLDYLYYTTFEVLDPALTSDPTGNMTKCAVVRSLRTSCSNSYEIQWADFDRVNGPLHTDDESLMTCAGSTGPIFGTDANDDIEVTGGDPGWVPSNPFSCGGTPTFKGTKVLNAVTLGMPDSNGTLAASAASDWTFTGRIRIQLNGSTMNVWQQDNNFNDIAQLKSNAWPPNGLIYVNTGSCSNNPLPTNTDYDEDNGCGNVYVKGSYSSNLSIATSNDIIVNGDITRPTTSDALLGLMAERYVRVYHPVVSNGFGGCNNASNVLNTVSITAAIIAVQHSFMVDNHTCGALLGNLSVTGAIAQKFRGPVGTSGGGGTGYKKNYNYDSRLRFRNPPFFLDPKAAAWTINRSNEQVPAARPTGL